MLQIILAAGIRQSVKKADTEHPLVSLSFSDQLWLFVPGSVVMGYCVYKGFILPWLSALVYCHSNHHSLLSFSVLF